MKEVSISTARKRGSCFLFLYQNIVIYYFIFYFEGDKLSCKRLSYPIRYPFQGNITIRHFLNVQLISESASSSPFLHLDLFGLLLGLLDLCGERVCKRTADRNSRSDNSIFGHWLAEENGRNYNNNDTFSSVKDRGCNSSNIGSKGEGELIVNVKEEPRKSNVHDNGLSSMFSSCMLPFLLEGWEFRHDDHGNGEEERNEIANYSHV